MKMKPGGGLEHFGLSQIGIVVTVARISFCYFGANGLKRHKKDSKSKLKADVG